MWKNGEKELTAKLSLVKQKSFQFINKKLTDFILFTLLQYFHIQIFIPDYLYTISMSVMCFLCKMKKKKHDTTGSLADKPVQGRCIRQNMPYWDLCGFGSGEG